MAYQNNHKRYQVDIGFNVDPKGIKLLQQELKKLEFLKNSDYSKLFGSTSEKYKEEAKKMRIYASEVRMALQAAYNPKLKTTNIEKFNRIIKQSGLNLSELSKYFSNVGITGQNVSTLLTNSMTKFNVKIKESHKLLDKMGKTLTNTLKWNLSATLINNVSGSIQQAWGFTKNLQQSLTNIRMVTGKNADEMKRFAQEANKAASQLGRTTTDYTKASLIYAQQGLSDAEIKKRSEITLKTANVTGQSTEAVSEELTAVWNGYKVNAAEAEIYVDRLAAVASTTASSLSELSTGMSKVASAAASLGVGEEQLAAQLSTIISVTRQAPETVGTALKTIYSRISDIQAGIDEDGTTLGTYSGKLAELGIKVLDASGKLRNMGQVMEEIGSKWGTFSKEQQTYIAQTMAGQRQYTNLIALFDNYQDKYISALKTAQGAEGTLNKQNKAYMEDINTKINQMTVATEKMWMNLIDTDGFKGVIDDLTKVINKVDQLFQSIGGGKAVLNSIGAIATQLMSKTMASGINTFINNRIQSKEQKASLKQAQTDIQDKIAVLEAQGKGDSIETKVLRDKARFLPNMQHFSNQSISKINQLWDQSTNAGIQADIAKKQKEEKFDPLKKFAGIKEVDESNLQGIQANIEAANEVFKTDQDAVTQIIENSASNIFQVQTEEIKTATEAVNNAQTIYEDAIAKAKEAKEKLQNYTNKKKERDAAKQTYEDLNQQNQDIKVDNKEKRKTLKQGIDKKEQQIQNKVSELNDMIVYEGGGYRLKENFTDQDYKNLQDEIQGLKQEKNALFDQLNNLPKPISSKVAKARKALQKAQNIFKEEQVNNRTPKANVKNADNKVEEEKQNVNQAERDRIKAIGESRLKAFNNSFSGTIKDKEGKERQYDLMKYIKTGQQQGASDELKGFAQQYKQLTKEIEESGNATAGEIQELDERVKSFFNALNQYAKQSAGNLETEGQKAMEALQKQKQALKKAKQAAEEAKSGMRQATIQGILQLTGALGQLNMTIQNFANIGNIWDNEDLTEAEKFEQTISNLLITIPMLITGYASLSSALGKFSEAKAKHKVLEEKEQEVKEKNIALQKLENVQQGTNTVIEGANAGAKEAGAKASNNNANAKRRETKEIKKQNAEISKNTLLSWTNIKQGLLNSFKSIKSGIKGLWTSMKNTFGTGGAITTLVGAGALATFTMLAAIQNRVSQDQIKNANKEIDKQNEKQQAYKKESDIIKTIESINLAYKNGEITKTELIKKSKQLQEQYKGESKEIQQLIKDYNNWGVSARRAKKELSTSNKKSLEKEQKALYTKLQSQMNSTITGTGISNFFAAGGQKIQGKGGIGAGYGENFEVQKLADKLGGWNVNYGGRMLMLDKMDSASQAIGVAKKLQEYLDSNQANTSTQFYRNVQSYLNEISDTLEDIDAIEEQVKQSAAEDELIQNDYDQKLSNAKSFSEYNKYFSEYKKKVSSILSNLGMSQDEINQKIEEAIAQKVDATVIELYQDQANFASEFNVTDEESLNILGDLDESQLKYLKNLNLSQMITNTADIYSWLKKASELKFSDLNKTTSSSSLSQLGQDTTTINTIKNKINKFNNINQEDKNNLKTIYKKYNPNMKDSDFEDQWNSYFSQNGQTYTIKNGQNVNAQSWLNTISSGALREQFKSTKGQFETTKSLYDTQDYSELRNTQYKYKIKTLSDKSMTYDRTKQAGRTEFSLQNALSGEYQEKRTFEKDDFSDRYGIVLKGQVHPQDFYANNGYENIDALKKARLLDENGNFAFYTMDINGETRNLPYPLYRDATMLLNAGYKTDYVIDFIDKAIAKTGWWGAFEQFGDGIRENTESNIIMSELMQFYRNYISWVTSGYGGLVYDNQGRNPVHISDTAARSTHAAVMTTRIQQGLSYINENLDINNLSAEDQSHVQALNNIDWESASILGLDYDDLLMYNGWLYGDEGNTGIFPHLNETNSPTSKTYKEHKRILEGITNQLVRSHISDIDISQEDISKLQNFLGITNDSISSVTLLTSQILRFNSAFSGGIANISLWEQSLSSSSSTIKSEVLPELQNFYADLLNVKEADIDSYFALNTKNLALAKKAIYQQDQESLKTLKIKLKQSIINSFGFTEDAKEKINTKFNDLISNLNLSNVQIGSELDISDIQTAIDALIKNYNLDPVSIQAVLNLMGVNVVIQDGMVISATKGNNESSLYNNLTLENQKSLVQIERARIENHKELNKYLEDERDLYHDINREIAKMDRTLSRLETTQQGLTGVELYNNLTQQNIALNEKSNKLKIKSNLQEQDLAQSRTELSSKYGVTFSSDGEISNYLDILASYENQVNAATAKKNSIINSMNAWTDADGDISSDYYLGLKTALTQVERDYDHINDKYSDLKTALSDYDSLLDQHEDTIDKQTQTLRKQIAINVQKFDLKVSLQLDLTEAKKDWEEFKKNVLNRDDILNPDTMGSKEKDVNQAKANYGDRMKDAQKITSSIDQVFTEIDNFNRAEANGETYQSNLFNSVSQAYTKLTELQKKGEQALEDAAKYADIIKQAYLDAFSYVQEEFDKQNNYYSFISQQLSHDVSLIDLIYGSRGGRYKDNYYNQMNSFGLDQIDMLRQQQQFWAEQEAAATDEAAKKIAHENWENVTQSLNSTTEQAIQNLKSQFENMIDTIVDELENSLTNGHGFDYITLEWDILKGHADMYLDAVNSAFAIKNTQYLFNKAISNTSELRNQQALKKVMQQQMQILKEKDKLTQYDVDRAEKVLEVEKARIALEEARNNKTTMRLKRDASGNYSYQFTADEEAIDQAQNNLDKAQNDLYNFDLQAWRDNNEKAVAVFKDAMNQIAEIRKNDDLSVQQRQERIALIQKDAQEKMTFYAQENNSIRTNLEQSTYDSMVDLMSNSEINYSDMIQGMNSESQSFIDKFNSNPDSVMNMFNEAIQNMQDKATEYDEKIANVVKTAGLNFGNLKSAIDPVVQNEAAMVTNNDALISSMDSTIAKATEWKTTLENIESWWKGVYDQTSDALTKAQEYLEFKLANDLDDIQNNPSEDSINKDGNETNSTLNNSYQKYGAPGNEGLYDTSPKTEEEKEEKEVEKQDNGSYNDIYDQGIRDLYRLNVIIDTDWSYGQLNGNGKEHTINFFKNGKKNNWYAGEYGQFQKRANNLINSDFREKFVKEWNRRYDGKYRINSFDTGGYTGDWNSSDGKLAVLHEKELVLNKDDTENMLKMLEFSRTMSELVQNNVLATLSSQKQYLNSIQQQMSNTTKTYQQKILEKQKMATQALEQQVKIEANFPSVTSHKEIEQAFSNLVNLATQKALKYNKN